jgi:Putative Ig domain
MSILSGILAQQIAQREGLTDTNKYLLLGWMLNGPLGLGVTLALANQEADSTPATAPAAPQLSISTPAALLAGTANVPYAALLQASGGKAPLTWQVLSQPGLPQGLSLVPNTGVLSGTPAAAGTYSFIIQVTDSATPKPATATQTFTLTIAAAPAPPGGGEQIGPAQQQLPAGRPRIRGGRKAGP